VSQHEGINHSLICTRLRHGSYNYMDACNCTVGTRSFGVTSSATGDAAWLSKFSTELEDGGDDDTDVAQLVEDGVGESLS